MTTDVEQFRARALTWLDQHRPRRTGWTEANWGQGSDLVPVFNNLPTEADMVALIEEGAAWQRARYDAGFAALTLPREKGGQGLPIEFVRVYNEVEALFDVPVWDELLEVTIDLVAPTLAIHGQPSLLEQYLVPLLRAEVLCSQLFSEPSAGSDLASLSTSAVRVDGGWLINGQKIWSSGAQHADIGLLIARTDRDAPRHQGLTAFVVPLSTPGVDVRPIRQMTGGWSFCEVFLTDVFVPDDHRIGEPGEGWTVALTTLKFERENSGVKGGEGLERKYQKVVALAQHHGRIDDPLVRQALGDLYVQVRAVSLVAQRNQESLEGGLPPGPEGSLGKLMWSQTLGQISEVVALILGPALIVDDGTWGTFTWSQHILGAPGFRIAGGSDEIQRTIIAERVLGLPKGA